MKNAILSLLVLSLSFTVLADDFNLKLKIETVDHAKLQGAMLTIKEGGKVYLSDKVKDEEMKIDLEAGRVYEVWIQKVGYVPHVIHNVHKEGTNKFKVTLYKRDEKYPGGIPPYHLANREFDKLDKYTVPAELANEFTVITKEEELTDDEKNALKKIQDMGKDQEKRQKKMDALEQDIESLEKEIKEVKSKLDKGEVAQVDAEKEIERLEKKRDKAKKDFKDLKY